LELSPQQYAPAALGGEAGTEALGGGAPGVDPGAREYGAREYGS
jgi:hypothetical protein